MMKGSSRGGQAKIQFPKANLTMTIPEEEEPNHEQFRKDVRTKLFKEYGIGELSDKTSQGVGSSAKQNKPSNTGENSLNSQKQKENEESLALKINFITLEGDEWIINIPDLEEDPIFAIMGFAIERRISDLAILEIIRRKAQREIMRIKGNYNRKAAGDRKKTNGDETPAMSTSTLQSFYRQPQETFQDYLFSKKVSYPVSLPKPATPKSTKATSKASRVNSSFNSSNGNSAIANLKNVLDYKRKSDALIPTSPSGNLSIASKEQEFQIEKRSSNSRSPPAQKPEPKSEQIDLESKKLSKPSIIDKTKAKEVIAFSKKTQDPNFVITPSVQKIPSSMGINDAGIPEVSYTLNIKKKTTVETPKPPNPPPPAQNQTDKSREVHGETIKAIFQLLDSDGDGILTGSSIDMGALMDASIDLLDAMQDVIADIFDSSGVDLAAFARLVEKRVDLKRLTEVYLRAKTMNK